MTPTENTNDHGDEAFRSEHGLHVLPNVEGIGSFRVNDLQQAWELCDMLRRHRAELEALNLPKDG